MTLVVSMTDEYTLRQIGPEAFVALVEENVRSRQRSGDLTLEDELAIRNARIEELQRSVVWTRPAAPAAPPPRSTRKAAWTRRPTTTKTREYPWTVTLDPNVRPRFEVYLGEGVCRSMIDCFSEAAPYRVETGGFLFGNQPLSIWGGAVCHASRPAPNSKHGRHFVSLGSEAVVREEVGLDGEYFHRLGRWHTHPTGDPRPSRADMDAWSQYLWARDRQRLFEYVAVIVTPARAASAPAFTDG